MVDNPDGGDCILGGENIISNPFCGNLINFGSNFMRFFLGTLYENDSVGTEKKTITLKIYRSQDFSPNTSRWKMRKSERSF